MLVLRKIIFYRSNVLGIESHFSGISVGVMIIVICGDVGG